MRVLSDGRVRRTRSEWQVIMREFEKSGLTVTAFCERKKISASVFAAWKRKFSEGEVPSSGFVELKVKASESPSRPVETPSANGEFELVLPGGAVLRWKA